MAMLRNTWHRSPYSPFKPLRNDLRGLSGQSSHTDYSARLSIFCECLEEVLKLALIRHEHLY